MTPPHVSSLVRILLLALALAPSSLLACATCFGASDSDMAKGMNMGILSLLIVVVAVLSLFAAFFVYIARRSASHPLPTITAQASVTNHHS